MKKIMCDRCGIEFKYLNDVEFEANERRVEDFILDRGGNYCRKCTIDMISEIQAILDAKVFRVDELPPQGHLPHPYTIDELNDMVEPLCADCRVVFSDDWITNKQSKSLIVGGGITFNNFVYYTIDKDTMTLTIECLVDKKLCSHTIKLFERGAVGVTVGGVCRYASDDRTDFLNGTLIRDVIDTLNKGLASDDVEIDISRFVDQSARSK